MAARKPLVLNSSGCAQQLPPGDTLAGYQPTLVSGTNIQTINGVSILASGNLDLATASQVGDIATALDIINGV